MKVLVVLCLLVVVTSGRLARFNRAKEGIPGRYIIRLKDGVSLDGFMNSAEFNSLNVRVRHKLNIIHAISVDYPQQYIDRLRGLEGVDVIEEDAVAHTQQNVASWGLDRIDQRGYPLDDSFTPNGHGAPVKVYIIDTGIRHTHVDFAGRAIYFYDFEPTNRGNDCNGHGTHCSGTAAGTNYGVAKSATLYSARVLSCLGSGAWSDSIKALDLIVKDGGDNRVASMSLGGFAYQPIDDAVEAAIAAGVVVSIAAGNSGDDACSYSPARTPSAVTVGATIYQEDIYGEKYADTRASFSNWGSCLDIFAPGQWIVSSWYNSDTDEAILSGTSMACPHVSGAAAILLSNGVRPDDVPKLLAENATPDVISGIGSGSPNLLLYVGI